MIGNSMGIYLPREFKDEGYESGLEVEFISQGAGILIRPLNLYKSRINNILDKENELIPEFYSKDEEKQSLRFEDLKTNKQRNNVISFVKDHVKNKLFMYYLIVNEEKEIIQSVKGNYV